MLCTQLAIVMNNYRYREGKDTDVLEKAVVTDGEVTGWQEDMNIPVNKDPIKEDVCELKDWRRQQETAVPDGVINGIKEIVDFLANTPDTGTLASLLSNLTNQLTAAINAKYTKPISGIPKSELAASVQASLEKADSSIQDISGKQDAIEDLTEIRSGATKGATAYQKPVAGIPESDLHADVQSLLNKTPDIALILAMAGENSIITTDTNPEWKYVLVDSQDRILMGKKQDGIWYFGSDLETIVDWMISTYETN